ncbi:hypothetical protein [Citricoccus sp. GCM10030269]|uniref:hypothetical protein n=1 Tax=Citricoccus sp. GCM10030269 TaxID=3273388 RepID=UPI00361B1160
MEHVDPEVPEEVLLDEPQPQFSDEDVQIGAEVADDPVETPAHHEDEDFAPELEEEPFPATEPPSGD